MTFFDTVAVELGRLFEGENPTVRSAIQIPIGPATLLTLALR